MNKKVLKIWSAIFYATQVAVLMWVCFEVSGLYTLVWAIERIYPYAIEYEGHVFWASQQLAQGSNIYDLAMLTHQPWCVIIYNPAYMLVGAVLIKLVGMVYWPFRILTMCSTLLVFLGFFIILDRSKLREFFSIIGLALFASSLPVLYWSGVARVDMLGLALSVFGAERFQAGWLNSEKMERFPTRAFVVSLILFVLAYFTKQQYFVFPVACALFLCVRGQSRLALKFFCFWLTITLALSLLIQMITGGYWAHLSYAAGLPWEWDTLKLFLLPFLMDYKTIAAGLVIIVGSTISKRKAEFEELAQILLVLSLPLALYTMGLRAAYHNHLLCTELALFWLAALNLSKLASGFSCLVILALAFSTHSMDTYLGVLGSRLDIWQDTGRTITLLSKANLKGKPILSEDPSLAMFVGACPAIIDGTTVMNMSHCHPEQLDRLITAIRNKEFEAIIINRDDAEHDHQEIWPRPIVKAIKQNYRFIGRSGGNGIPQSVFLPIR